MNETFFIIAGIIVAVLAIATVVLYFLGKRLEKKQAAQKEQMDAAAQNVTMLIIDKKRMRMKDSGLPAVVIENTPKLLRRSKMPIVKAKIGPKVMTMICEESIFDLIPVKKEVKAVVSGLYITSVKGVRGPLEAPQKKLTTFQKLKNKLTGAAKK